MRIAPIATMRRVLSPAWLAGPILEKELRVSSRRRRNYALRVAYVLVLTLFVGAAWLGSTGSGGASPGYRVSRMSEVGKQIIVAVIWLQFCAAQLLAVVMLSTAISEEVRRGTLPALLTTPISGFQLVLGKLLSKMWQISVLLAISLPVLAVVRVFGGVPWSFVLSATCITLTASMFAGSVSLLLSVSLRHAYAVIPATLAAGFLLYVFVYGCLALILVALFSGSALQAFSTLGYVHPFFLLELLTRELLRPGSIALGVGVSTLAHCLVMLGLTCLVLASAGRAVRRAAMRQGEEGPLQLALRGPAPSRSATPPDDPSPSTGSLHGITGSPLIWIEMQSKSVRHWGYVFIALACVLPCAYGLSGVVDLFADDLQALLGVALVLVCLVTTTVSCAAAIPIDKESRTWPVLLSTALSDDEVLTGKIVGALRCSLPGWLLLLANLALCYLVGAIHPVVLVHTAMLACGVMVALAGLGMYVGSRVRRIGTAVVICLGIGLGAWLLAPGLLASDVSPWMLYETHIANPVVQMWVIVEGASRGGDALDYHWTDGKARSLFWTTARIAGTAMAHVLVGVLLARRAKRRFRRNIF
jgi:ABC-2 type transport system permease protein